MSIARKLTVALLACVLVALALNTVASARRQTRQFEEQIIEHQRIMARALRPAIAQVWRTDGQAQALRVVEEANQGIASVDIRWVWLEGDAPPALRPWATPAVLAQVRAGQDEVWTDRAYHGQGRIFTYVAVASAEGRAGAIEISESLMPEREVRRSAVVQATLTAAVLFLAAGTIAGGLGYYFIGRPLRALAGHAERVGAGDFEHRIEIRRLDEVGTLARAMNAMCERLATAQAARARAVDALRHADRLATVGRVAAGMAHELGTPLNVVGARAKPISKGEIIGAAASDSARIILEQVDRMARLVRQLLDMARRRTIKKSPTDLNVVASHAASVLSPLAAKRGVTIVVEAAPEPVVAAIDPIQIEQVVMNLVMNAVQASDRDQEVRIQVRRMERETPGFGAATLCASIEVSDRGGGIRAEDLPRIFEPFFSTKASGEGTGLGLSIADGIVREHGGWIDVHSEAGVGARFTMLVPEKENTGGRSETDGTRAASGEAP